MRADIFIYNDCIWLYMGDTYTTMRISKKLKRVLGEVGKKNETYEDIIWRLIREAGYDVEKL